MGHPRSAHIGAIGEGWVLQTFASVGVGTARPSVDLDGIDLVAWVVENGEFRSAPLQIKTTSDGNITLFRTKYPDYLGMLYVILAPDLKVEAAYLLPQEEAGEIGAREFGHTDSWMSKSNTYRGPFSRVAENFGGFEFTASTAVDCLRRVMDRPTCVGSVGPDNVGLPPREEGTRAMSLLGEIKRFDGTEAELVDFLVTYSYQQNDTDQSSWDDVAMGPHPDSFAALQTIPESVLPRDVLLEVYRRRGVDV